MGPKIRPKILILTFDFSSNSVMVGLSKLFRRDLETKDHPALNSHGPFSVAVCGL